MMRLFTSILLAACASGSVHAAIVCEQQARVSVMPKLEFEAVAKDRALKVRSDAERRGAEDKLVAWIEAAPACDEKGNRPEGAPFCGQFAAAMMQSQFVLFVWSQNAETPDHVVSHLRQTEFEYPDALADWINCLSEQADRNFLERNAARTVEANRVIAAYFIQKFDHDIGLHGG